MKFTTKKPYKFNDKYFAYNEEDCLVYYLAKMDKQMEADNAEWVAEFGQPIWHELIPGFAEVDCVGLGRDNWKNKEMRDSYLQMWCDEMDEFVASEIAFEVKNFL